MKFIQRDVNKRLIFLVVLLLVLLTVSTIYYGFTLKNLLDRYNKDQEIFGKITSNTVINDLNTSSNLQKKVKVYKEYIENRYDELNTLNNNLKNEVERLKAELNLVNSQIEYQKAKEIGPTENFRLFQSKNDEINKLRGQVKGLCSQLETHNISNKDCVSMNGK